MKLNPLDVLVETYNTGGPWVPKFTGVKLTHIPTGITVRCSTERSVHANRNRAWGVLQATFEQSEQLELF